jgi:hypothetical protein
VQKFSVGFKVEIVFNWLKIEECGLLHVSQSLFFRVTFAYGTTAA